MREPYARYTDKFVYEPGPQRMGALAYLNLPAVDGRGGAIDRPFRGALYR